MYAMIIYGRLLNTNKFTTVHALLWVCVCTVCVCTSCSLLSLQSVQGYSYGLLQNCVVVDLRIAQNKSLGIFDTHIKVNNNSYWLLISHHYPTRNFVNRLPQNFVTDRTDNPVDSVYVL